MKMRCDKHCKFYGCHLPLCPRTWGLFREWCAFLGRVRTVFSGRVYRSGIDVGPVFEVYGDGYIESPRTRRRADDVKKFAEDKSFSWKPAMSDQAVFLRGWDAGEKWAGERKDR